MQIPAGFLHSKAFPPPDRRASAPRQHHAQTRTGHVAHAGGSQACAGAKGPQIPPPRPPSPPRKRATVSANTSGRQMSRSVPVPTRNLTPMSPCQLLRCHQSRGNPAMDGSQRVPTRRRDPRGCWAGSCTPAAAPRGNGFTPSWTGAITRHPTAGERPKCISGMRSSRCLRPAAATGPFTTGTAKKKREPQGSPQSHSLELHGRVSQQKPVPRSEKKKKPKPQKTQPNPCAGAFSPARTRNSHLRLGGMGAGDAAHGGGGGSS